MKIRQTQKSLPVYDVEGSGRQLYGERECWIVRDEDDCVRFLPKEDYETVPGDPPAWEGEWEDVTGQCEEPSRDGHQISTERVDQGWVPAFCMKVPSGGTFRLRRVCLENGSIVFRVERKKAAS